MENYITKLTWITRIESFIILPRTTDGARWFCKLLSAVAPRKNTKYLTSYQATTPFLLFSAPNYRIQMWETVKQRTFENATKFRSQWEKRNINSALTVVVIQRADTRTPTTTTKKKRKMAVVTGDDDEEPGPLLHRRPSGITAAAAEAIAPLSSASFWEIWTGYS